MVARSFGVKSIDGEPWVQLPTETDFKNWREEDLIAFNQKLRQGHRHAFYMLAFDMLYANEIKGDYFEFGCHRARTFRMALSEARRRNLDMRFLAFDSFMGLPDIKSNPGVRTYTKQNLSTSEEKFLKAIKTHGIYTDRVKTISGYYSVSLNTSTKKNLLDAAYKAALVTVDCDLYESAVPVFAFIEDFIQEGTILYLDDSYVGYQGNPDRGIGKAFQEYTAYSKYKFHRHMNVGWWGLSYIVYR